MQRNYLPTIGGYIPRARLRKLYDEGLSYPLVLVLAGPGYGKTLSVAHFFKTADVRLMWIRITGRRSVALEFWEDFVAAAAKELPEYAQQLEKLGFPSSSSSYENFRKITAEVAEQGKRIAVVIDNYERILSEHILSFINNLMDSEIPNFTLFVLCSRKLPFVNVLPVQGQFRVTDEDLAFTPQETAAILEQSGNINSSAAQIMAETGGWPLALHLMCISSHHSTRPFAQKTAMQIASELFEHHYFLNYPPEIRTQLIRLSLLPQFSLEMIPDGAVQDGGKLYEVVTQHPFITYNFSAGLFAIQPMYHDFLRQKLAFISVESRQETLSIGGRWFSQHAMHNEALDCFWEAADYEQVLYTILQLPKIRYHVGTTNRILQRLENIPRSYADKHPEVDFCIAFMYLNAAEIHRSRELFLSVEQRLSALPQTEERRLLLGDIYATLADISTYLNEDTGLTWIKKARQLIPHGSRTQSPQLMMLGNNSAFYLASPQAGELERMVSYFMQFAHYAEEVMNGNGLGFEYLFAGEAAYYREEMDKAADMFNCAILKAQQTQQHDIICNALWGLMRIELYFANHKNAQVLLQEIENYIQEKNLIALTELRDCAAAWFYLYLNDIDKVPSWLGNTMAGPEELPVEVGRNRLISAYYLHTGGHVAKSYAVLRYAESTLEGKGRWHEKLTLYILKAMYHLSADEPEAFEQYFFWAYSMLYQNNIKIALAEYGRGMMKLIDQLKKLDSPRYSFDMDWLNEVYKDSLSYAKRLQTMCRAYHADEHGHAPSALALTKREDETLRYLAQGLTQQEMAKLMGISSNAIKKHIGKIYQKLGAVNRADAIHIASINGLVDLINS